MGWIQKLFGERDDARTVVLQSGESRADQAVCVKLDGAYIIDLRSLPLDTKRILGAIEQIASKVQRAPQPIQVWVMSPALLEAFREGSIEDLKALPEALFIAIKGAQAKLVVEEGAHRGMYSIMRGLGFEICLPGLRLCADDGSEIDVLQQLEKLQRAPRLRV
jgi:hypothetical protein